MIELLPHHVREWIVELQTTYGARRSTIREVKVVLDAILTTALNDQVVPLHAGRGVQTPPVARKPRRIIAVEQYDGIYAALTDDTMRLLVRSKIETGLRWGELTELRPRDLDQRTRVLTSRGRSSNSKRRTGQRTCAWSSRTTRKTRNGDRSR